MTNTSTRSRLARYRRHTRVRSKVKGTTSRPRLCVFRSLNHIYVQVIDDSQGNTLVAASTLDTETKNETGGKDKSGKAELIGTTIAKRALIKGIKQVAFDRGGYKYHGRVRALAEAARQGGLKF
ncbi:MAG: 50S ribosomal protein L18 [Dehalococcoidales bacterium]|nr:50S ribosomal protein L18 [Dehalococcoidales bacterium]